MAHALRKTLRKRHSILTRIFISALIAVFILFVAIFFLIGEAGEICRYTEEEYEELFLQSQSKQYVFAKDDSSYYCVLLPTDVQSDSPDVNAFMDSIRENEIKGILDDMIRRNDLEQY